MDVHRTRRGLQRRLALIIVGRMKQPEMQDGQEAIGLPRNPPDIGAHAVLPCQWPAARSFSGRIRSGLSTMKLAHLAIQRDGFKEGVAADRQVTIEIFHQVRPRLFAVGMGDQPGQRSVRFV